MLLDGVGDIGGQRESPARGVGLVALGLASDFRRLTRGAFSDWRFGMLALPGCLGWARRRAIFGIRWFPYV